MSKIQQIQNLIEDSHMFEGTSGLTYYHAAAAVRDANLCRSIEVKMSRMKHALTAYRVTVALAVNDNADHCVRLHNRVTGKQLLL